MGEGLWTAEPVTLRQTHGGSHSVWRTSCPWPNRWCPFCTLISTGYGLLGEWVNPVPRTVSVPPVREQQQSASTAVRSFCQWAQLNSGWWLFGLEEMAVLLAGQGVPGTLLSQFPVLGVPACVITITVLKPVFWGSNSCSHNYVANP